MSIPKSLRRMPAPRWQVEGGVRCVHINPSPNGNTTQVISAKNVYHARAFNWGSQ